MFGIPQHTSANRIEGDHGPASALAVTELPASPTGAGEVLMRVDATGVNRRDVLQRMGFHPLPPGATSTLGLEMAGEIVVAGSRRRLRDKVCALLGDMGHAEYAAANARHVLPAPASLGAISAATLPETEFTMLANVFEEGCLQSGKTLLVHGANSGIGTTAIQMAKAAGPKVIATLRGVDILLDMVGGDYFPRNLDAPNRHGRIVSTAGLAGTKINVPVMAVMAKPALITRSTRPSGPGSNKASSVPSSIR